MSRARYVIRTYPSRISAVCFIVGFALIVTGWLPIQFVGVACLMLAFLVPFFGLPTKMEREREAAARADAVNAKEPPRTLRPPSLPSPSSIRHRGTEPS